MQVKNIDYARDVRLVRNEMVEYIKDFLALIFIFTFIYFVFLFGG